jgi:hypothetical protein
MALLGAFQKFSKPNTSLKLPQFNVVLNSKIRIYILALVWNYTVKLCTS